jgi:hypothetical protein
MAAVEVNTEQYSNTLVLINSDDRIPGQPISKFNVRTQPLASNIIRVTPISFDFQLFINNITQYNHIFTVGPWTVDLPLRYYSYAEYVTEISNQLTGFDPNFVVTDNSNLPGTMRLLIQNPVTPFIISVPNQQTTRLSGLYPFTVPVNSYQGAFTKLLPTYYFDVCAPELHRGLSDDDSNRTTYGVLFRVPTNEIPFVLRDVVVLQQSGQKHIFYPQRTAWPVITWSLLDEWGNPMDIQDGSIWWVSLTTTYIQSQPR